MKSNCVSRKTDNNINYDYQCICQITLYNELYNYECMTKNDIFSTLVTIISYIFQRIPI